MNRRGLLKAAAAIPAAAMLPMVALPAKPPSMLVSGLVEYRDGFITPNQAFGLLRVLTGLEPHEIDSVLDQIDHPKLAGFGK